MTIKGCFKIRIQIKKIKISLLIFKCTITIQSMNTFDSFCLARFGVACRSVQSMSSVQHEYNTPIRVFVLPN